MKKHFSKNTKAIIVIESALSIIICLSLIMTGCGSRSSGTGATVETVTPLFEATTISPEAATTAATEAISEATDATASASAATSASTFSVAGTAASTFYVKGTPAVRSDKDSQDDNSMSQTDQGGGTSANIQQLSQASSSDTDSSQTDASSAASASTTAAKTTASETQECSFGIDVASYQGVINWEKVAQGGVTFAMVRTGYRSNDGVLHEDANARYNLQEANKHGIKTGAYFFSRATSTEEALQEANLCLDIIKGYSITYPVAYNCEGYRKASSRQYGISMKDRSSYAQTFLSAVSSAGYSSMFYASKNELSNGQDWDTASLAANNKIWIAYYPSDTSVTNPGYSGSFSMWQFTSKGSVPGIEGAVDIDIAYFGYSGTSAAKSDTATEAVTANMASGMTFTEVNEQVTAKNTVNLRDRPSQGSESQVIAQLTNGQVITRTGINTTTGWSRLEVNGYTLYAVSSYLTTDLNDSSQASSAATAASDDDGIKTVFTECNDLVTPKDTLNLRALPSVTNPDAVVVVTVSNGEVLTRTGINNDVGWSRVVYNGQTLYCVSSYLMPVQ